jgi:hypothetical protein
VLAGSLLVRPFVEGARPAAETLGDDACDPARLAAAWRRWHDLGFRHGDAYPKNVLVSGGGDPIPIGFPRARWRAPGEALDDARVRDLAQWVVGMEEVGLGARTTRFLDDYGVGLPEEAVRLIQARVEERAEIVRRKKAVRRASQAVREPEGPPLPRPLRDAPPSRPRVLDLTALAPDPGL